MYANKPFPNPNLRAPTKRSEKYFGNKFIYFLFLFKIYLQLTVNKKKKSSISKNDANLRQLSQKNTYIKELLKI